MRRWSGADRPVEMRSFRELIVRRGVSLLRTCAKHGFSINSKHGQSLRSQTESIFAALQASHHRRFERKRHGAIQRQGVRAEPRWNSNKCESRLSVLRGWHPPRIQPCLLRLVFENANPHWMIACFYRTGQARRQHRHWHQPPPPLRGTRSALPFFQAQTCVLRVYGYCLKFHKFLVVLGRQFV